MSQRTLTVLWSAIVMIGILEFKLIHDSDIFWQVKLGTIMLNEGRIPISDRFTYTHAGKLAPPIGWLAQILFASLYELGGWHLARLVHHAALVGSLIMAAATCKRNMTSPFSATVAISVAFLVMLSNADLRPQSLGLLSFATLLAVGRSRISFSIKLVAAIPLFVAWQNMHPSVAVGVAALAGLATADFLDRGRDRENPWKMVILTALAATAQLATPLRAGIFDVSRSNLRVSRDVLGLPEWAPPWDPIVVETVNLYWMALAGSLIAIIVVRGRVSVRDGCLFVVMTIMSLYAARFIIFWAVASVPIWASAVERICPIGMFVWARGHPERSFRAGRSMIGLAMGAAIAIGAHPARFGSISRPAISP